MKNFALLVIGMIAFSGPAFAIGQDGNGGDPNELRFRDIASNIKGWIQSGNADQVKLPPSVPLELYKSKMQSALESYHIQFTTGPVMVAGVQKTCRNWRDSFSQKQIQCNSERFHQTSVDEQYQLVHHEIAGLAGLEVSFGQDSSYLISDQVSAYLRDELVRRLPIVPVSSSFDGKPYLPTQGSGKLKRRQLFAGACKDIDQPAYISLLLQTTYRLALRGIVRQGFDVKDVKSLKAQMNRHHDEGSLSSDNKPYWFYTVAPALAMTTQNQNHLVMIVPQDAPFIHLLEIDFVDQESESHFDREGRLISASQHQCGIEIHFNGFIVRNSDTGADVAVIKENQLFVD